MVKSTIDLVESEKLVSDIITLKYIHQCYTMKIMWIVLLIFDIPTKYSKLYY